MSRRFNFTVMKMAGSVQGSGISSAVSEESAPAVGAAGDSPRMAAGDVKKVEFTRLESAALTCVIERAIDELCVISYRNKTIDMRSEMVRQLPLPERIHMYEESAHSKIYDHVSLDPTEIALTRKTEEKLQRDSNPSVQTSEVRRDIKLAIYELKSPSRIVYMFGRTFVANVMSDTWSSMSTSKTYKSLQDVVRRDAEVRQEEEDLFIRSIMNTLKLEDMRETLKEDKEQSLFEIKTLDAEIQYARREAHDAVMITECEKRLVDKYENARVEQSKYMLNYQEEAIPQQKKLMEEKIRLENRIDTEAVSYIVQLTEKLAVMVGEWREKYEEDLDKVDTELVRMTSIRRDFQDVLDAERARWARTQREIKEYLQIKSGRQYNEFANLCATKIQAWWRGIWYRLNKGKKKKKGKKGKEKGKKGKSKKGKGKKGKK